MVSPLRCQAFPVIVSGTEVLRFYDTPGFQNSKRALAWFREQDKRQPPGTDLLALFRETHVGDPNFSHECELFWPVAEKDAGILYVVDGSARITENYLAEMEMLRMTGRPRIALINHKDQRKNHTAAWEIELGKFFNQTRRFNAHRATHHDRIALLRALQHMDGRKGWHDGFEEAIDAFERRWDKRRVEAVATIVRMVGDCLGHVEKANYRHDAELPALKDRLDRKYRQNVGRMERGAHEKLLEIYAHPVELEELEALRADLFHETVWQTLGLPLRELVWAATASGAMTGLGIDALLGGHSLGAGAVIGGALGGGGALLAGKQIGRVTFNIPWASRLPAWARPQGQLGGQQVQASCTNVDFVFVLLDRALLLFVALVSRAAGRAG